MTSELQTLLALQDEDAHLRALHAELDGLTPRERELDRELERERQAAARVQTDLDGEDKRHRDLAARLDEHRRLHERNVAQLDQVKKVRDATAAQSQLEMARRMLADEESEMQTIDRRRSALRDAIGTYEERIAEATEAQKPARAAIAEARSTIQERIREAQAKRDARSRDVEVGLLSRYDRITRRARGHAVFAVRGLSCGNCDTAIPLQRRNGMLGGKIEVCEGCGVLLYLLPDPPAADTATAASL